MWVLIKVGSVIGALSTIVLVLLTAVVGIALLRRQGFKTLLRARNKLDTGELPAQELAEAIFLAVGGALLLAPGFITDAIGFCCLIPGIRQLIIGYGLRHMAGRPYFAPGSGSAAHLKRHKSDIKSDLIEGDYTREDEKD